MILQDCQASGGVELFLLERKEVGAHIFDLGEHLIPEAVDGLYFLSFLVGEFPSLIFFLNLDCFLEVLILVANLVAFVHVDIVLLELGLKLDDFVLGDPAIVVEFPILGGFQLSWVFKDLLISLSRSLILFSRVILLTSSS